MCSKGISTLLPRFAAKAVTCLIISEHHLKKRLMALFENAI
jgi:hypothetical protein